MSLEENTEPEEQQHVDKSRTTKQRIHKEMIEPAFEQIRDPKIVENRDRVVIDQESYEAYKNLMGLPIMNEGKFYETEDGDIINCGMPVHNLKKAIVHMSSNDKRKMLQKNKIFARVLGKSNSYKSKAYGAGYKGGKQSRTRVKEQMNTLMEKHEDEILELFGRMFSPQEVQKYIVEELEINTNMVSVLAFRKHHLDAITMKIEQFKKDFSDIRLSNKKGRLEELVWLYHRAKSILEATGRDSDRDFMLKVLEQVRKECEGDKIRIDGNFDIKMEATINLHAKKDVLSTINLNQIIIGRVASRMNVPASKLIKNMMDSYYNQFNGIISAEHEETLDAEYEVMNYPTAEAYDFSLIKRKNKALTDKEKEEDATLKESIQKNLKLAQQQGFKEILLGKIAERKKAINSKVMAIQQATVDNNVARAEGENKKLVKKSETVLKDKSDKVLNRIKRVNLKKRKKKVNYKK